MSSLNRIYYTFVNVSIRLLVRSKIIPKSFLDEADLNLCKSLTYVLPSNSKLDLFTLRIQCLKNGLPDPLIPLHINGITLPRYFFIDDELHLLSSYSKKKQSVSLFYKYLDLHRANPSLDIQFILVLIMFGRSPCNKLTFYKYTLQWRLLNNIEKFFKLLWLGRDSFVQLSRPLSLRYIDTYYGMKQFIAHKLARVARIYFIRQRLAAVGPSLLTRQDLFKKLLVSNTITKAIENEARKKKFLLIKHNITLS